MPLTRNDALTAGVDPRAVLDFIDAQEAAGEQVHALLVLRHGQLLAEGYWAPFESTDHQLVYSLSKTFTSAAVGICVADGLFGYDDRVVDLLPELAGVTDQKACSIRVRDCLAMATGHEQDQVNWADRSGISSQWLLDSFARDLTGTPGETFCYNQLAPYILSRIVTRHAGVDLLELLQQRVLGRLGAPELHWLRDAEGNPHGFSGLHVDPVTAARFFSLLASDGCLVDQDGRPGERLLPSEWVDTVGTRQVVTGQVDTGQVMTGEDEAADLPADGMDWARGYGWLTWQGAHGFRGDGAYGQYGVVLPTSGVVVLVYSEVHDMQLTLDNLWRHLYPGIDRPGSAADQAELDARLRTLATPPVTGDPITLDGWTMGWHGEQAFQLGLEDGRPVLKLSEGRGDEQTPWQSLVVGHGEWVRGELRWPGLVARVAASAAVVDGVPTVHVRSLDTPHTMVFHFGTDPERSMQWRIEPLGGPELLRDLAVPA